jgi:hypothetical protein
METIRIVKRKKGSSYIWGILLALIIIGAIVWLLVDQNVLDREGFSANRDTTEYGDYRSEDYRNEGYRDFDNRWRDFESDQVHAYVSFVNSEVVPADSIDSQMTREGVNHLKMALNEVAENQDAGNRERIDRDSITISDSREQPGNEVNQDSAKKSLINAGSELVDIQRSEYPSLAQMGEAVKESLNDLQNSEKTEELKNFFILSSNLIQEMHSERTNDQLTTKRRSYENNK